jgi:alkanesulfonate monooxygenase SsuD/methylene tetrahydromethanopterin reductase-like flavin-dependent oxidoreductase (luciferase family)
MQIGVVYPQIELRGDPTAVRRIGRAVEDLGFDHLLAYDHVLGAVHADRTPELTGPYTEHDPFHDPFVMFAYLAGITERLRFATGILILPQRQIVDETTSECATELRDLIGVRFSRQLRDAA